MPAIEAAGLRTLLAIGSPRETLANLLEAESAEAPEYDILTETGRATHNPTFVVGVYSGEKLLAEAASFSIKEAKNEAARAALRDHFASELDEPLPDSWGGYTIGDTENYIGTMVEETDGGGEPSPDKKE